MFELTPFGYSGRDLMRMFDAFDRDFFNTARTKSPAVFCTDIRDAGESYLLEAELPGFDRQDIAVDVQDNTLTISAKRSAEKQEKDQEGRYITRERRYGSYRRSFDLTGVDAAGIRGEYADGVLKLTLPKVDPAKQAPRRIELQ